MLNRHSFISQFFRLKVIFPAAIIIFAAAAAYAMIATGPRAHKRAPEVVSPTVEVATYDRAAHQVTVEVMGTVIAAHEVTLKSQVAGEIVGVSGSFVPGGFFSKGDEILRIDPKDYELALNEMQAEVADAEYDLKVELGYQNVAGREWKLLQKSSKGTAQEAELALRKPHLAKAKADLEAANAKLSQAKVDLGRTKITAPFAAIVQDKATDLGEAVASQEELATIVGTDEFWVEVSVPVDRLDYIQFPDVDGSGGSQAVVISGTNGHTNRRDGHVIRLLPSLESEGRMARVLVAVDDPLNLKRVKGVKPLLLGTYVKVDIDGGEVSNTFDIPRSAFRDNSRLWVLSKDGLLDIREINPVWRDADSVLIIEGLNDGERVVTSGLSTPMQGMKLQVLGEGPVAGGAVEHTPAEVRDGE